MRECGDTVIHAFDSNRGKYACALPAGHPGDHHRRFVGLTDDTEGCRTCGAREWPRYPPAPAGMPHMWLEMCSHRWGGFLQWLDRRSPTHPESLYNPRHPTALIVTGMVAGGVLTSVAWCLALAWLGLRADL